MSSDPASFIEGVPVKIVEKFRPPRKVTLPAACNYQVNVEILTQEYDFIAEKEALKWVETCQKRRRVILQNRAEQIEKYAAFKDIKAQEEEEEGKKRCEEEKREQAEREASEKTEDEPEKTSKNEEVENVEDSVVKTNSHSKDSVQQISPEPSSPSEQPDECEGSSTNTPNRDLQTEHSKSKTNIDDIRTKNGFNYIKNLPLIDSGVSVAQNIPRSSAMLVPTQCDPQISFPNNSTKVNSGINFADFEGDASDPFDNAALKSINDMEELAQVLQSSNISQQNIVETHNPNYQASSYYPYKELNPYFQQSNLPTNSAPYNPPQYQSGVLSNVTTNSVPSTSNSSVPLQPNYGGAYFTSWNIREPTINKPSHVSYGYEYSQAHTSQNNPQLIRNNVPVSHVGACTSSAYLIGNSLSACNTTTTTSEMMPISKRQDLEDFYSRYYSFHRPITNTGARSGENTPIAQVSSKSLRSCSSVPDLTLTEDNEVSKLTSVCNAFGNDNKSLSNAIPQRPSSTGLTEIKSPHEQMDCYQGGTVSTITPPPERARLPDPFPELNSDAQKLVKNMSEMGFPRARVARAVQKLGTDHKKLIEVLLILQSFKDDGENEYRSEVSFYYYMGDLEKVKEFLSVSKQLLDLGFDEEKVVGSLFKFNNDQGKTLEELIT